MAKRKVEEIVEEIALPVVENKGFELVDVEFVKEGSSWFLRVYIDKPGGITIDDCSDVSNELGKLLDKADPIQGSYYLEVSSPGLERPLKKDRDFERYKGETVEVRTFRAIDGHKVFEGTLLGLVEGNIEIDKDGQFLKFPRESVASVKKVFKFK
ncbi:MAG TPA: ribosome maturation factor RimP [Clostridiaceae bacterium]|jgi:ribosome maturation factor RimP|nr:ribosome maturation factor RimP [Clostridiaceae bacterium]